MKLYSRTGSTSVINEDFDGSPFTLDEDGAAEFPDALGTILHSQYVDGLPAWENNTERHNRLVGEEAKRRSDPAELLKAVERMSDRVEKIAANDRPLTAAELRELADARRAAAEAQAAADQEAIDAAEKAEQEAARVEIALQQSKASPDGVPANSAPLTPEEQAKLEQAKAADDAPAAQYEAIGFKELQALAKDRGVGAGGTKQEIAARLAEQDAAQTPATPAAE